MLLCYHFIDDQVAVWYGAVSNVQNEVFSSYVATIDGENCYAEPEYKFNVAYIRDRNVITVTSRGWQMTIMDGKIYKDDEEFVKNTSVHVYQN